VKLSAGCRFALPDRGRISNCRNCRFSKSCRCRKVPARIGLNPGFRSWKVIGMFIPELTEKCNLPNRGRAQIYSREATNLLWETRFRWVNRLGNARTLLHLLSYVACAIRTWSRRTLRSMADQSMVYRCVILSLCLR
jgi:hypothetical protein